MSFKQKSNLDEFIVNLNFAGNHRLGKALKKWKNLINYTVVKIAAITMSDPEDVLQSLLVPLVRMDATYEIEQCRYERSVYDFISQDGDWVTLRPNRFNLRRGPIDICVPFSEVEFIKKASFSSLVYTKIEQEASCILKKYHAQKNGFMVVGVTSEQLDTRANGGGKKTIDKREVIQYEHLSMDECIDVSLNGSINLHDLLASCLDMNALTESIDFVKKLVDNLSENAKRVVVALIDFPKASTTYLSKSLNLSRKAVQMCQREIRLELNKYFLRNRARPSSILTKHGDRYYYYVGSLGDYSILNCVGAGKRKMIIDNDFLELESSIFRNPVHFKASVYQ